MKADTSPKISVLIVTYNHEKFVRQAIESVLMQKTAFEFEVIIADDYSQDATPTIAREYASAHPNVRILPTDAHLGITRNYQRGFANCRGEYVAILEGDDYWISPVKLSSVALYLDQHPESVLCFHRLIRHDEVSDQTVAFPAFEPRNEYRNFTARQLASENFIGGFSTCMYRRNIIASLDPGIWKLKVREWPFNVVVAQHGLIGYVPEIMSVYRAHLNGIWSLKPPESHFGQLLEILDPYNEYLDFKYDSEFQAVKLKYRPIRELPIANEASSRLRRWIKPFMPPVLVSLVRTIFYRDRGPA
jgi:glycosyltransferase involved in cell wall biosynthesis